VTPKVFGDEGLNSASSFYDEAERRELTGAVADDLGFRLCEVILQQLSLETSERGAGPQVYFLRRCPTMNVSGFR
jgi:hypothetical protein